MQDFRDYPAQHSVPQSHNSRARASKLYHSSSPSPEHGSYDDNEDEQETSIAGSAQQSSDPDEAVFEPPSQQSSPGTSHPSDDDDMSEFPPDVNPEQQFSSPYTPHKIRPPFRNPSSVRAMQMDTTPPHLTSSPSQQRYNLITPSRNGTPRSMRSSHSAMRSQSRVSPTKKLKKEYPLVLLHVTLLPIPIPYSTAVMESVLPHYILENWKLLRQKATQTVLDRGILIPHPKEDYDLLEERLLESLELKTPRILKCGHFHLDPEEEADVAGSDSFDSDEDEDNDADICDDCGRRIRDGRFGTGVGSKRWDIKLFAANGLMRAGAWGAAWREMERVDVEIVPWMDEDMKRQLELRRLDEAEAILPSPSPAAVAMEESLEDEMPTQPPGMDDARMREIYGDSNAQPYVAVDDFDETDEKVAGYPPLSPSSHPQAQPENQQHQPPQQHQEIPIPILLRNYIYLLIAAQDGRNLAIGFLSFLVLVLTLRTFTAPPQPPLWTYDAAFHNHRMPAALSGIPFAPGSASSIVTTSVSAPLVVTTATTTTTTSVSISQNIPSTSIVMTAPESLAGISGENPSLELNRVQGWDREGGNDGDGGGGSEVDKGVRGELDSGQVDGGSADGGEVNGPDMI